MKEVKRIVDLINRAFWRKSWHGPSVMEILEGVNSEQAAVKTIQNVHSIWEIIVHIIAWKDYVQRRLTGEDLELTDDEDWPTIHEVSENAWLDTLKRLEDTNSRLVNEVTEFDASRLDDFVPGKDFSYYVMIYGVIQHDLYHAGQIALLKKLR